MVIMCFSVCLCLVDMLFIVGMRIFGMIRICVGVCGEILWNVVIRLFW